MIDQFDPREIGRLVASCSTQLRKGEEVVTNGNVTDIYLMPHKDDVKLASLKQVDLHFVNIGVDEGKALAIKDELVNQLNLWPDGLLKGGPSYIATGAYLGDQGLAFQLYAVGEVLGLWKVILPETLGFDGETADQMAGSGLIMISGYGS